MLDDDDFQVPETRYAAQCPQCTERLQFEQDGDQLHLDDPASCHFHGVIGTRRDILRAIKNGDIQTVRYDVPNTPPQKGLNKWGYLPQPGDVTLLARIMLTEAAGQTWDYPGIGWATITGLAPLESLIPFPGLSSKQVNLRALGKIYGDFQAIHLR
jgi:hypothetical protein